MPFRGYFNSREISCGSRDPSLYDGNMVGLCGATPQEITKTPGNYLCGDATTTTTPSAPQPAPAPVAPVAPGDGETSTTASATTTQAPTTTLPTPVQDFKCLDSSGWTNGYSHCGVEKCRDRHWFKDSKAEDATRLECKDYGEEDGCMKTGWSCDGYVKQGWCRDGKKTTGDFAFGRYMNHPERNCCACGGGTVGECKPADMRRRRRQQEMCACRRRDSGSREGLKDGWTCKGNFIVPEDEDMDADEATSESMDEAMDELEEVDEVQEEFYP
eukprot:TRINITY_DN3272_c0_g1_i1.p1 TRINITY_DN3272_c0_g1~~TRINITY_DN3272_c0_g1_i1.p1  ORF type:complete len:272 (+),score=69.37 TRINITY_DN3272_c0_g1_i1:835-1650(+)